MFIIICGIENAVVNCIFNDKRQASSFAFAGWSILLYNAVTRRVFKHGFIRDVGLLDGSNCYASLFHPVKHVVKLATETITVELKNLYGCWCCFRFLEQRFNFNAPRAAMAVKTGGPLSI